MKKVLLAIDEPAAEEAIEKYLSGQFEFSEKHGQYKEQLVNLIESECPDILVIKESLKGSMSFDAAIHNIKIAYPSIRIVVITGKREVGDPFFKSMLKYGVYDVLSSHPAKLKDILLLIKQPKSLDYILQLAEEPEREDYEPTEDAPLLEEEKRENPKKKDLFGFLKKDKNDAKIITKAETPAVREISEKEAYAEVLDDDSTQFETRPISNHYGTEILDDEDDEDSASGFVFMPYEIQPVAITDYTKMERIIVNPDGTSEKSQLPIKSGPKPLINQKFDEYARKLLMDVQAQSNVPQKTAKVTVFTSVRQGTGCSTVALNTAISLSRQGNKVLMLDACIGRSSLYSRLEFPLSETDNIDKALIYLREGESVLNLPLSYKKLMKELDKENQERLKELPTTLAFLKYSDEFSVTNDLISAYVPEMIRAYGQIYDYIIVDTTLSFFDTCTYKFLEAADNVFLVTLQDYYELNLAYDLVKNNYKDLDLLSKLGICVNRYYNKIDPESDEIQKYFQTNYCFTIPSEEKMFLRANSQGVPYYLIGNRKVNSAYDEIAEIL